VKKARQTRAAVAMHLGRKIDATSESN
jgi:hypothetical protein